MTDTKNTAETQTIRKNPGNNLSKLSTISNQDINKFKVRYLEAGSQELNEKIEEIGITPQDISEIEEIGITPQDDLLSLSVAKQKNNDDSEEIPEEKLKHHYEEKFSVIFMWGLYCTCIFLVNPAGSIYACAAVPTQFLAFALIPFHKIGTEQVLVFDRGNPKDAILLPENADIIKTPKNADIIKTPKNADIINTKENKNISRTSNSTSLTRTSDITASFQQFKDDNPDYLAEISKFKATLTLMKENGILNITQEQLEAVLTVLENPDQAINNPIFQNDPNFISLASKIGDALQNQNLNKDLITELMLQYVNQVVNVYNLPINPNIENIETININNPEDLARLYREHNVDIANLGPLSSVSNNKNFNNNPKNINPNNKNSTHSLNK